MNQDRELTVEIDGTTYRGSYVVSGSAIIVYYKDFAPLEVPLGGGVAASEARWTLENLVRGAMERGEPV